MKIYDENQFLKNKNVSIDNFGTEGSDDLPPRKWKDIYIIIPSIIKSYLSHEIEINEKLKDTKYHITHNDKISILGYDVGKSNITFYSNGIEFDIIIYMDEGRPIEFDVDEYENSNEILEKIKNGIKSKLNKVSNVDLKIHVGTRKENGKRYVDTFEIVKCSIEY